MDGSASWQNTGRETKLWIFNSTTSFPILLFLVKISVVTLMIVVVTMIAFSVLGYFGFTVPVAFRYLRGRLAGPQKQCRPWWTK